MKRVFKITIMTMCIIGMIYGAVATILGGLVIVYHPYEHATDMPYGMNDVVQVMLSDDGYIYTLGRSLVQRFDMEGKFCGGGYFSVGGKRVEVKGHGELLSLNNGNIVVYSIDDGKICVFDDDFEILSIERNINTLGYFEEDFYADYPNTDAADDKVAMSRFFNSVKIAGDKITLEAPRNMIFSYLVGLPLFALSAVLFVLIKFHKENTELKELRRKYGRLKVNTILK